MRECRAGGADLWIVFFAFKSCRAVHHLWASCDEAVDHETQHLAVRNRGPVRGREKLRMRGAATVVVKG
jgi:hypothetical protein